MKQQFTPGEIVKYSNPVNEAEVNARFTVIENRGDRLLVQYVCDAYLKPQNCFSITEFSKA